jgi:hypothetical protein
MVETYEVPSETAASDGESDEQRRSGPQTAVDSDVLPREYGGRKGPEPTRYGDWEKNGRCIDF